MGKSIETEGRKKNLRVLEEEEDTLSLSDLSIDCEEWEEKYYDSKSSISSSSSSTSSSSSDHEDAFEFISNYNSNNNVVPPENILFCGKLIPYKNPTSYSKKPEKWWRSSSFSLSSSSRKFLGYYPTNHGMELKDLKNRQNRKVVGDGSKGKGILWSMIKVLSCTSGGASYHAQSAVKASIGCISLV